MTFVPAIDVPASAEELRTRVRAFLADERERGTPLGRPDSWFAGWDREFSRRLAEHGWVGMTLPVAHGGGGRSPLERYVVIEELLAAGAPVAAHWVSDRQAGPSILAHGTDAQRAHYLPAIARGECFFSIGMSEQGAGSDLAAVATRAERHGEGWRVTGTKMWTGGSHVNDAAIVLARSDPAAGSKHAGLSQFIVDLHAAEVRSEPIHLLTGEHRFNATHLDDAPGELLGAEGSGWAQVTGELAQERSGPERFLSTFPLLTSLVRSLAGHSVSDEAGARVGALVARLAALRRLSLGVAAALARGESPDLAAALVKDLGTRFEQTVVEEVRALSTVVADPGAEPGSHAELLAVAIGHLPAYTLRGGTTEILRSIITKGLGVTEGLAVAEGPGGTQGTGTTSPSVAPAAPVAEQAAAARALGERAVEGNPIEDAVARRVLAAAGRPVPEGPLTFASFDRLTVRDTGGGRDGRAARGERSSVVLDGELTRVPWGRCATTVLLTRDAHGPLVVVLEPGTAVVAPGRNLAGEPRDTLALNEVTVEATPIDPAAARDAPRRCALLRAAAMSGAAQRAADLALAHVRTREQFGRPLAAFGPVKQSVAELAEEVALVQAAVAVGVERDDEVGVAVAKGQASASAATITRIAHQLHGAIGFTERSSLGAATTRLWSWRDESGDEHAWAARLGALAGDDLWDTVVGGSLPRTRG